MQGYPEDCRTEAQRRRAPGGILGDTEWHAARVVARLLGERVILQDDNSVRRMPDLRIEYADGRLGYVEVVSDLEPAYAGTWEQVVRRGHVLPAPGLARNWYVTLKAGANVKAVERRLPAALLLLEDYAHSESDLDTAEHAMHRLGVVGAHWGEAMSGEEPAIRVSPEGATGPADVQPEAFSRGLDELLRANELDDAWTKLADAEVEENHLFLGITFSSPWPVYRFLRSGARQLPVAEPDLVDPVSGLWLMGVPFALRCLHWTSATGWINAQDHWRTA